MRGPLPEYRALIEQGALHADPAQEAAAERLQALETDLAEARAGALARFFGARPNSVKGVYLWGAVGRGKSLLMDIFFNHSAAMPKRRVHYHEFMTEAHQRIADYRALDLKEKKRRPGVNPKYPDDPMPPVAYALADDARLLCLDEFQVSDIADAMILGRLFEALFRRGVTLVATSNRPPDDLYKDGINRQLFLPFIDMLKARLDIVELVAARDYRLEKLAGAPVYYAPLDPEADKAMDRAWGRYISGASEHEDRLEVQGRSVPVPRAARGAARFDFSDLCAKPLGAADYLAIANRYGTVFLDRIPRMHAEMRNEARRFVNLIDAIYDARVKLVCSADGEPDDLYPSGDGAFEFERTASRLMEMRSAGYLAAEHEHRAASLPENA